MKIELISPEDEEYGVVATALGKKLRNKVDYAELQKKYNELEASGFLMMQVNKSLKIGNVAVVLNSRGLERGTDYEIAKLNRDIKGRRIVSEFRPLVITKLTERPMV